jgi:PadR family transcriptional regulator, regulatory protein PadR
LAEAVRPEVLKGNVDVLLLASVGDGEAHGYGIVETLRRRSQGAFELAEGTVYPALYRLERQGLLESRWDEVRGRRRRVYRLTRRGHDALAERRQEWSAFTRAMEAVLG